MGLDRLHQVGRSSVVQEEDALPESPERRGAELPRPRLALADPVRQPGSHVVHQQVGVEVDRLIAQRRHRGVAGVNAGVWQSAQPVLVNRLLPRAIDAAPPGVSGDGSAAPGSA